MALEEYDGGLSNQIAIEVHRTLGPGLLKSAYERCLAQELTPRQMHVRRQVPLPVEYKGLHLECSCRLDVVVEDKIMLEIIYAEAVVPVHAAPLLACLRSSGCRIGLLSNFHVPVLKQGIIRKVI